MEQMYLKPSSRSSPCDPVYEEAPAPADTVDVAGEARLPDRGNARGANSGLLSNIEPTSEKS